MKNIIPTKKLEQALRYKDDSKLRKLIRQGYDISEIDLTKVFRLKNDIILTLIKHNKHINITDNKGYTPLLLSIIKRDERIVEELLKKGANVNFEGKVDMFIGDITPFSLLLFTKENIQIIKLLIEYGADLKYDNIGWRAFKKAILDNDEEVYKILIDCQVHMGKSLDLSAHILFHAVYNNNFALLKRVIEKYEIADVNYTHYKFGRTLLPIAVANESYDMVKFLIKHGIDINQEFIDGTNSLMIAVNYMLDEEKTKDNEKIIRLLIDSDIDINKETDRGFTALMVASKDKHSTKNLEILLNNGANINHQNKDGLTALISSIKERNFKVIKILIEKGADVNIPDHQGITPLMLASWQNDIDILKLLSAAGADNEMKDNDGYTAYDYMHLHLSQKNNILEVYKKENDFQNINNKISAIDTNHGIDNEKFKQWLEKSNQVHNPKKLSKLLHKFSNDRRLKYTNHPWTDTTYRSFYKDIEEGWSEIKDEIKVLSENLYKEINKFLFETGTDEVVGFSSNRIKQQLESGKTKPDQIKELSYLIDTFKQSILIKNDEDLSLLDLFGRVLERLPEDINIDLEDIEDFKGRFYTNVKQLESAIEIILKDIYKIDSNANIKISIISSEEMVDLKIIHKNSSYQESSEVLKNTIGKTGNFTSIYENLRSVCDWEVETTCSDGAKVIHYLYLQRNGEPYIESSNSNDTSNFTHTLRIYK